MRAAIAAVLGAFLAGGIQPVSGESIANPYAHVRAMQKEGAALLGHELQHAVEVAEAPGIHSAGDLRALYREIGVRTGADSYDSIAARQAGFTVRDELTSARGGIHFARSTPIEPMPEGESIGEAEPAGTTSKPAAIPAAAAPADSVMMQERD